MSECDHKKIIFIEMFKTSKVLLELIITEKEFEGK